MSIYEVCQMQYAKNIPGCPTTSGPILHYASLHTFLAILTILCAVEDMSCKYKQRLESTII